MSFFDVPTPEAPDWEPSVERPEWAAPPRGVLPGYSPQRATLFKSDEALLLVHRFLAYPTGVEFELTVLLRDGSSDLGDVPWELHRAPRGTDLPDEFLRFGILFADGSKWTNLDWRHPRDDEVAAGPVVMGRGGGGGGDYWEMSYWLWPLPPEGPLTFFASWPGRNLPESQASVDGTEIRERAKEAEVVWQS